MIFLLFPHQLFRDITPLVGKKVFLIEEPLFFTQYQFHIQKIVMHRASMKAYEEYLLHNHIDVCYYEDESYLLDFQDEEITCYDVVDFNLEKKLRKYFKNLTVLPNPNFLNATENAKLLHSFYIAQRKKYNILMDNNAPQGGKWSFDSDNRKKLPKDTKIPAPLLFQNRFIDEAKTYAKKFDTQGKCTDFYYPTTFLEAKIVLTYFLETKFAKFGDYQDAITQEDLFLFHSNLSSALNIGLLELHYVIEKIVSYPDVPLNAKEGLLRQIIGWREYMLRIYKDKGVAMRNSNYFGFKNSLPQKIKDGKSGLAPLDRVVAKVSQSSYAHHIERLMILGNIFVLLEIEPNEMYEYFMANFIDAYDWVMVGNVYGMSGYSNGGGVATKPYIASSNYILKMSDYKKGPWCEILDALYWNFLDKHKQLLATNHRMKMQLALLAKMNDEKLQTHKKIAKEFKISLGMYDHSEEDMSRFIEMAWQDRTTFEAIQKSYGLSENQIIKMMRKLMSASSFKMWRKRMHGRKTKHEKKLSHKPIRFQGPW